MGYLKCKQKLLIPNHGLCHFYLLQFTQNQHSHQTHKGKFSYIILMWAVWSMTHRHSERAVKTKLQWCRDSKKDSVSCLKLSNNWARWCMPLMSVLGGRGRRICMSLRTTWTTECIWGQADYTVKACVSPYIKLFPPPPFFDTRSLCILLAVLDLTMFWD